MKQAWAITRATVGQLLTRRRAILFGLAAIAPAIVYLLSATALTEEAALDRLIAMMIGTYFPLVVPIVSLMVATAVLGSERRDNTLSFLVLRPMPRWVIAAAKVAAAIIVAGAINALGAFALTLAYAIETGTWGLIVPLVVGGVVATAVYAAVFVPLGFFTDRAVVLGLIFVFVFENGVVFAAQGLSALSPWRFGLAAFINLAPDSVIADSGLHDGGGVLELVGMPTTLLRTATLVVLSIALVAVVLRRRDLAGE